MKYSFKLNEEAIWFVLVAAGTVVLQSLATLDLATITDWRTWAIGLGVAALRAGAGATLSLLAQPAPTPRPLPPFTPEQVQQLIDELERRNADHA